MEVDRLDMIYKCNIALKSRINLAIVVSSPNDICSGQVKLATDLEEFQKSSSVLFGVNPSLC